MIFKRFQFSLILFLAYYFFAIQGHCQISYIVNSQIPFESKFIQISNIDHGWIEILPVDSNIDFSVVPKPLNEQVFMNSFITVLNLFRKRYGRKPLNYSPEISENLKNAMIYGAPLDGISHNITGFYYEYNYVKDYSNSEFMFGEFLIDHMKITFESFQTLVSSKVQNVGYYFKQNMYEGSYDFMIYIK